MFDASLDPNVFNTSDPFKKKLFQEGIDAI